jgi:hypothetical protein
VQIPHIPLFLHNEMAALPGLCIRGNTADTHISGRASTARSLLYIMSMRMPCHGNIHHTIPDGIKKFPRLDFLLYCRSGGIVSVAVLRHFLPASQVTDYDVILTVSHRQCCQAPPSLHCHFSPKPRPFWHLPRPHTKITHFSCSFRSFSNKLELNIFSLHENLTKIVPNLFQNVSFREIFF